MTNYKPSSSLPSLLLEQEIIKKEDTDLKYLVTSNNSMTTTGKTFHKLTDNLNYQVPSGKQYRIIAIQVFTTIATGLWIYLTTSTAVDSNTGEVLKYSMQSYFIPINTPIWIKTPLIITENLFINNRGSASQSTDRILQIMGYEETP